MKQILASLLLIIVVSASGQTVIKPNYGIKSHEVLTIDSIASKTGITTVYISAKVPQANAPFCVNKNTFIRRTPAGDKYQMILSKNVANCPGSKVYKNAGEKFTFELIFPRIDSSLKFIDLVEDCSDACFFFKGIILDKSFNAEIEDAYASYAKSSTLALEKFKQLISSHPDYPFGFAYINIIKILAEKNELTQAHQWYVKLQTSLLIDKSELDEIIKQQPYYKLIK